MTLKSLSQYNKGFQIKVLGSLLTDRKFLLEVRDVLSPDYFDSDAHKWIISSILKYFDKYNTTVTLEVLKIELQKVENEVLRTAIKAELRNSYEASTDDVKYVQEEFATFCKNQLLKAALLESADLLASGDFELIRTKIDHALKAGVDKNLGHLYDKDIETRYRVDYRPTIPTPWETINKLTQGGFGPGDLVIVFGSPGGGKSWAMVGMAAHAVTLGYNVVYYTLELGEDYVGKRFDCYLTGHSIDVVNSHRKEVEDSISRLKGKLLVKEYSPKSASILTIKSHLQKCIDNEFKPDMVIIDYVDYLSAPNKKYTERKDQIDDVFIGAKGLAKEFKIPVITPSQVNRMGAKDDIIEGDKVAGSYDKMMVADICFSLARKKEDKVLGTGRLHVMKNRYGMDGMTYDLKIDTNNGHMEVEKEMVDTDIKTNELLSPTAAAISRKFFELRS